MRPVLFQLAFLAMGGFVACGETPATDESQPPHIVVVTLDTLRADHLGCYGYPRDTSPFIDSLAERGAVFDNAFSAMATTVPAHASMFTGRYPSQLSVLWNGHRLNPSFRTLAEALEPAGYQTAAFVSTMDHFVPSSLDRGFSTFDDSRPQRSRPGQRTVERAVEWLATEASPGPLFLWVHLFDPHSPYTPRTAFADAPAEAEEAHRRFLFDAHYLEPAFVEQNERLLEAIRDYDGEIAHADQAVENLYQAVSEKYSEDVLWIVTSDHGEGLGNHAALGHGKNIYNEQIRVPLIFHSSAGAIASRRIDALTEHVDLVPTILDFIGAGIDFDLTGLPGRSLHPLLAGDDGRLVAKSYAFSQRRVYRNCAEVPSDKECEEGRKFAIQNRRFKFILRSAGNNELYDLVADPYETRNLAGSGLPQEKRLFHELRRMISEHRATKAQTAPVDAETLKGLRSLGYIE